MSTISIRLDAGGLLLPGSQVDAGATEPVVSRTYRHPALGDRRVIRLASERLGTAEDLAMEFLGFGKPEVSTPIAIQQRRSLGFAEWALINDPGNARYALDLVKRMKAAARQAKSKPGHAWDAYAEMAKELGRSVRHFLPPFWEDAGRAFKDLGNPTYAGRALNKSLEAERVHALPADRARRRDVILEFVLSGCLAGNALSEYGNDLQGQYPADEAFAIFRDLCARRTRGGMAPWAAMPKDFAKLAKAAGLVADAELEGWLEEVIDAPAMARAPLQFWKSCASHCKRIVARSPAFAVSLLRHTRPEPRYYGESTLGPWLDLLDAWGVFPYLWDDEHNGAPPMGEPIAEWFGRIIRDDVPTPARILTMLESLTPRLKREGVPLPLSVAQRYRAVSIDIDVLEACLAREIPIADPPTKADITFAGWLAATADHPLRNQDLVASPRDDRFQAAIARALDEALTCRGGEMQRGYRQANLPQRSFPEAAGDRPGIKALWHRQASALLSDLEGSGFASFAMALTRLESTLWPETLRLFPDLAERLKGIDPAAILQRTLQAGVFDEYGLPALDAFADGPNAKILKSRSDAQVSLTFPKLVVTDKVHAHVIADDGKVRKHELRLPKKSELISVIPIGDDLAIVDRDDHYQGHFRWASDPKQQYEVSYYSYHDKSNRVATSLEDGGVFLGQQAVRPGDKPFTDGGSYLHDGSRFWRVGHEYDYQTEIHRWTVTEVDPRTGKTVRESVPPWFEETAGGEFDWGASELMLAPPGAEDSPLGTKGGLLGWKVEKRHDSRYLGVGIDGRRWDEPLRKADGSFAIPVALLRQPGTNAHLPVTSDNGRGGEYWLWDPSGSTVLATLTPFDPADAPGQPVVLPLPFWHLMKTRDEASSRTLRGIDGDACANLLAAANEDRKESPPTRQAGKEPVENPLTRLLAAIKTLLPTAPDRLAIGIARTVERAEERAAAFAALLAKMDADAAQSASGAGTAADRLSDLAATHWDLDEFHSYGDEASMSLSTHLRAAAAFLKGDADAGDLPKTRFLWFPLLENLPARAWKSYWRALSARMSKNDGDAVPWLELLAFWQGLGIAELPGRFHLMEGYPEGAKKRQWGGYDVEIEAGASFAIRNGDDRFLVLENQSYHSDTLPYLFLRYSTAEAPGNPPGYQVKNVREIKDRAKPDEIATFLTAAGACDQPPLPSRRELEEAAARLSVSPEEIGLVWMGGLNVDSYDHHFLPSALRKALGWKSADANVARQALRNLDEAVREHLCNAAVAGDCASPFAVDRTPVLRRIEDAWLAKLPKRLALDAALQARLSALGRSSRWQKVDHSDLLAAAADPTKHPLFQPRPLRIVVDKDRSYSSLSLSGKTKKEPVVDCGFLRSIVQLVAVVHAETPAGHPARAAMPGLIRQATVLLDDPGLLLDLRSLHLYDFGSKKAPKPSEWLDKHVSPTKADAKAGTASLDDGLIVASAFDAQNQTLLAFRPASLKDEGDLARLRGLLAIDSGDDEDDEISNEAIPTVAVLKSPGFQKLAEAFSAETIPEGAWPQNPIHSAPGVVREIREKYGLDEDPAVLYAELLALPEPTTANVRAWNVWTASRFQKAATALAGSKLVLEATRARAGRPVFLPGEWVELKAPWLPIERWKLAHLVELDLNPRDPTPAGGPLALRPFADLYAAAWQRIVDGDLPRYQDVARKKRTK